MPIAGQLRARQSHRATRAACGNNGRAPSGSSVNGGTVISPRNSRRLKPRSRQQQFFQFPRIRRNSALRRFAADVDLDQHGQFLSQASCRGVQLFRQLHRINRVHRVEQFHRLACLVGLQMPDHVPLGSGQIAPARRPSRQTPARDFRRTAAARRRRLRECVPADASCSPPSARFPPDAVPPAAPPPRSAREPPQCFRKWT